MRILIRLAVASFAVVPQPSLAHDIPINTIEGLIQNCTLEDASVREVEFHTGLCLGFIKGVSNALVGEGILKVCAPPELDNSDLIESVISRARIVAKQMPSAPSAVLVRAALASAFGCP